MGRLTAKIVKALEQPGRYGDGGTLYLVVAPGGSKSWMQRLTIGSRPRDLGLGGFTAGVQSGSAYICQVAAVVDGGKVARSALVTAEVPCAFMVTPLRRDVLWTAGAEQVAVTTAPGCAWTAASESGFLAVTSGTMGTGPPR